MICYNCCWLFILFYFPSHSLENSGKFLINKKLRQWSYLLWTNDVSHHTEVVSAIPGPDVHQGILIDKPSTAGCLVAFDDNIGTDYKLSEKKEKQSPETITVDSRYLELGYLEFCKARSVFLNQKYNFIAFSNHNLALETFLQVQITRSAN